MTSKYCLPILLALTMSFESKHRKMFCSSSGVNRSIFEEISRFEVVIGKRRKKFWSRLSQLYPTPLHSLQRWLQKRLANQLLKELVNPPEWPPNQLKRLQLHPLLPKPKLHQRERLKKIQNPKMMNQRRRQLLLQREKQLHLQLLLNWKLVMHFQMKPW